MSGHICSTLFQKGKTLATVQRKINALRSCKFLNGIYEIKSYFLNYMISHIIAGLFTKSLYFFLKVFIKGIFSHHVTPTGVDLVNSSTPFPHTFTTLHTHHCAENRG